MLASGASFAVRPHIKNAKITKSRTTMTTVIPSDGAGSSGRFFMSISLQSSPPQRLTQSQTHPLAAEAFTILVVVVGTNAPFDVPYSAPPHASSEAQPAAQSAGLPT